MTGHVARVPTRGRISTSGLKYDVTVVSLDLDFL